MRGIFENTLNEIWIWEAQHPDENGKIISRVINQITGVNVLLRSDWPLMISFFKPRIIKLDEFWTAVKDQFLYQ
jgi:hypothetical protein